MNTDLLKQAQQITQQAFDTLTDEEQVEFIQLLRDQMLKARLERINQLEAQCKEMDARAEQMKKNNEKL